MHIDNDGAILNWDKGRGDNLRGRLQQGERIDCVGKANGDEEVQGRAGGGY